MKINNQFREKYYPVFVDRATIILGATLRLPPKEARDLARDFTSNFLYSKSLEEHFDSSKGDIEPFFSAWVRKTANLSYARGEHQWRTFSLLEDWSKGESVPFAYDFTNWFYSIITLLEGRAWVSGKVVIPYSEVFKAAALQVLKGELWNGEVRLKRLAKTLGVSFNHAKGAFFSLRALLNAKQAQGLV